MWGGFSGTDDAHKTESKVAALDLKQKVSNHHVCFLIKAKSRKFNNIVSVCDFRQTLVQNLLCQKYTDLNLMIDIFYVVIT